MQPPKEEYEEMKSSYCTVIENMNKEKAFCLRNTKRPRRNQTERYISTQMAQEGGDSWGQKRGQRTGWLDELNKQVSELSQLCKEAQAELEDVKEGSL